MTADPNAQAPLASRRHLTRLLLIIGAVALAGFLQSRAAHGAPALTSRLPLYLSIIVLQILLVRFVARGLQAFSFSLRVLIAPTRRGALPLVVDVLAAVATVVLLREGTAVLHGVLGSGPGQTAFLLPHSTTEMVLWVAVSVVSAVGEELVYRGYLQKQFWALTGNLPLAILLQAAVFAAIHVYQGPFAAGVIVFYGAMFGLLAAWRGSLIAGMLAHAAIDILGGLSAR